MAREVRTVENIIGLLFGSEDGILSSLFGGDDADGFGMADRARGAGEWCGTTPGSDSGAVGPRRARVRRGVPHVDIGREFFGL
jgi:hypothetical protein